MTLAKDLFELADVGVQWPTVFVDEAPDQVLSIKSATWSAGRW